MDDFESHPAYYERLQEEIILHHPDKAAHSSVPSQKDCVDANSDSAKNGAAKMESAKSESSSDKGGNSAKSESGGDKGGNSLPTTRVCWTYFMRNYKADMLDLEAMHSYDSYGDHGKKYVERYLRTESAAESFSKSD
jgi:hypothetical protein